MPISDVGIAAITTLEGLSQEGELHPVQRAFIEQQAAPCGFCINGMVIAAARAPAGRPGRRRTRLMLACRRSPGGLAFAHYENLVAYVATVAEVEVDRDSGAARVQRTAVAHDCGLIINPDGVTNQVEGKVIQSLSRALKEEVTFEPSHVTSVDWLAYPILTFSEVPRVDGVLINRPALPAIGAGEAATVTTAPAVANAIYDACGARLRLHSGCAVSRPAVSNLVTDIPYSRAVRVAQSTQAAK